MMAYHSTACEQCVDPVMLNLWEEAQLQPEAVIIWGVSIRQNTEASVMKMQIPLSNKVA